MSARAAMSKKVAPTRAVEHELAGPPQLEHSEEYLTDEVEALYQKLLHRQADPAGLTAFTTLLANGGTAEQVEMAQLLLQGLWHRLERGESLGKAEIDAAIRLANQDLDPRLPLSDLPAIRTRRGAVGLVRPGYGPTTNRRRASK